MIDGAPDIVPILEREGVTLKKRGRYLWGLCPLHSEKTPSFMVDPERQHFKCFGCGEGGDVIDFVQHLHNLSFKDALKHLGMTLGKPPRVDLKKNRKTELLKDFERWRKDRYNELCDTYNDAWHLLRTCRTMDEVEKHAAMLHQLSEIQYEIEILSEGTDERRFELYRTSI